MSYSNYMNKNSSVNSNFGANLSTNDFNQEGKLTSHEKDLLITKLKAQIFELEQNENNFTMLTQKFRNLQNE